MSWGSKGQDDYTVYSTAWKAFTVLNTYMLHVFLNTFLRFSVKFFSVCHYGLLYEGFE